LANGTDVVIESLRPGVMERLGLGYDALRGSNPAIVYCSITGFGSKGPYASVKGYEHAVMARSGRFMAFAGQKNRPGPYYAAVNVASHAAAMAAARGIVAALMVRDSTGLGQRVETSLLQAVTPYDLSNWLVWQMMVKDPENFAGDPTQDLGRKPTLGYLPFRTKDGRWIQMANLLPHLFRGSLVSIGLGHLLEDPRFAKAPNLTDDAREELRSIMLEKLQERTYEEWMHYFIHEAPDVAAEPFLPTQEGMFHPQMLHNGHVVQVEDLRVGKTWQLGPLAHLAETPGRVRGPAPAVGEHSDEVLTGPVARQPQTPVMPIPADRKHPLEGVTVIDMASVIAGPMGCALLAELGARVIRVEQHEGDYMRRNMRGIQSNRTMAGTEGISLDMKTAEGNKIAKELIARADVLVHNMRPGAPERLGIGYRQLKDAHPGLIYLYVGGYGSTGPYSHRPAMHPIPGAVMGGAVAQMGRGGLPPAHLPMTLDDVQEVSRQLGRANEANPDPNTSMVVATAATLALYARQRSRNGQYVEVTMLNANAYANAVDAVAYDGKPARQFADPDGYGLHALYRLYRAADDEWVFLAASFDEEWQALCRVVGRQEWLEDPRFATREARRQNDVQLASLLAGVFSTHRASHWERVLGQADVCCVEAEDRGFYHFFSLHPQAQENALTTELEMPRVGLGWRYSPLINFSRTPGKAGPGILRGQHTRSILAELGYTPVQTAELRAKRVVDWEEK
jgi:crotonobetainyl-CoA:carnitine CoA-transferase CaiB-like acyl-CoA transferase